MNSPTKIGICSHGDCKRPSAPGRKQCNQCLERKRLADTKYRHECSRTGKCARRGCSEKAVAWCYCEKHKLYQQEARSRYWKKRKAMKEAPANHQLVIGDV